MGSYDVYKKESLGDIEVKSDYDELQSEYELIQALIDARKSKI